MHQNYNNSQQLSLSLKLFCEIHNSELLTNFCSNPQCLRALCPECIDSHTKFHNQTQTPSEIDSIRNVKYQCEKKIKSGIQEIQKILDEVDQYGLNENEDQSIQLIRKGKETIINLVNQYFLQLEEQYRNQLETQNNQQQIYNQVSEQLRNTMNELEYLSVNMESSNVLNSIKRVCSLDLKNIVLKHRKQIKHFEQEPQQQQIMISLNEKQLQVIKQSLTPYACVKQQQQQQLQQQQPQQIQKNIETSFLNKQEYFKGKIKLLHFFEVGTFSLWLYDLQRKDQWREIQIRNKIEIPLFSKSLITPEGTIFLTGGSLANNKKSQKIYQFNFTNHELIEVAQLTYPRSSHGIIWKNNEIHIVGGYTDNQKVAQYCESIDCSTWKIKRLPNLNTPTASPGLCVFNDKLVKVGGIDYTLLINQSIEILINNDKWITLSVNQMPCLASMVGVIQSDQQELMIFGGYQENNKATNQCLVIEIGSNFVSGKLKEIKLLPVAEGFWNNTPIIYDNKIYALQNTYNTYGDNCLQNERKILIYDGVHWV